MLHRGFYQAVGFFLTENVSDFDFPIYKKFPVMLCHAGASLYTLL